MGPLANAGPDQRALPGMVVRLDGRGTVPPEDGRPHRFLWLQEAGPRVLLSDPTSAVTSFVAPPIRPAEVLEDRLVFRLVVEDGGLRSVDRVVVQLVEESERLESAPAVVAGADIEAAPQTEVELPLPSFLNLSCPVEEEPDCQGRPLAFCWTQVGGPAVELSGACGEGPTRFQAPARESVLIFRLDAHARGPQNPTACGPEALIPEESPLCAAPDYLRVFVEEMPRRLAPPIATIRFEGEEMERVERIEVGGPASEIPDFVNLTAGGDDPERWKLLRRFRPVLGWLAAPLDVHPLQVLAPTWPAPVGIAFDPWFYRHRPQGGQTRMEWTRAAPFLAILDWKPPTDSLPLAGQAGPLPCGLNSPEATCEPIGPGEEVLLRGRVEAPGAQGCWEQTYGPRVDLIPARRCADQSERRFLAPAPAGDRPLELAFQFTARDAGPYESRPSTLWLQIRPEGVAPPQVELEAPASLVPGESAELDAGASFDLHGGPLHFRWRQIAGPTAQLRECDESPPRACKMLTAPLGAEGSLLLEVEVASSASGLITRRRIEIPLEAQE